MRKVLIYFLPADTCRPSYANERKQAGICDIMRSSDVKFVVGVKASRVVDLGVSFGRGQCW